MLVTKDEVLIKSQFVQVVRERDKAVIWHSLFGNPKIVSGDTLELLDIFSSRRSVSSVLNEYDVRESGEEAIRSLAVSYYLIPKDFDERKFLAECMQKREKAITDGSLIDNLGLVVSEECNFRCTYCLLFGNLGTSERIKNPKKFMTFEIAKGSVDGYLAILRQHGKNAAEINFGGGEPLLAWPVIERVIEYCRLNYGREFTFSFSINTNASLITPEIAKKFKEHRVEILSSLDGLQGVNDRVRLTKSGGGTFETIMRGFENLAEQGCPINFAVTVNDQNLPFLDEKIVDLAIQWEVKIVRINIDIINMVEIPVENIVARLMRLRQYARERGIDVTGGWNRAAGNLNYSTLDANVAFCGPVRGNTICVGPSGSIYPCVYSTTQFGTLHQIKSFYAPESRYYRFVHDHLTGTAEMCKGCMIEGQCGGGCEITREFTHKARTAKLGQMCVFYCQMTRELLREQLREMGPEVESGEIQTNGGD